MGKSSSIKSKFKIDGARGSGSGIIVRTAAILAGLTGRELEISNIRAAREKPGLRPQHLAALRAIAQMTAGQLEGGAVGSTSIRFAPLTRPRGGEYEWEIGTAGSTTLVALTLLPAAIFADSPCSFRILGGVFQDFAPTGFHTKHALFRMLKRMGVKGSVEIERAGYVPGGQGCLRVRMEPIEANLRPLDLARRGEGLKITGVAFASHLKRQRVSERMAESCLEYLRKRGLEAELRIVHDHVAPQPGAALALFAEDEQGALVGADRAGAPGRRSEAIGRGVARRLFKELRSGATVDRHLADQLVVFAALARGTTRFLISRGTDHIESALWLVESLLGVTTRWDGQVLEIDGIEFRSAPASPSSP